MLRSSLSKLAQPARRYVHAGARHASSSANGGGARFCRLGAAAGAVGAVGLYATWQVTTGGRPLASDAPPTRERRAATAAGTEDRPLDAKSALEPAALESAAEEIAETPKPKRSYARKPKSDALSADPSSDAPTSASSSPALDGPPSESEPLAETSVEEGSDEAHPGGEGAGGGQGGAFNPETGEINWDCPCLGGMAHGPCGAQFREAFSCFIYSEQEPKGIDCVEGFKRMQDCFREHPDVYAEEIMDDDEESEQPMTAQDGESLQVPEPASAPVPETIPASPTEAPQTSRTRREQESSTA